MNKYEYNKLWRARNLKKSKAYHKAYRKKNEKKLKALKKKWFLNNQEHYKMKRTKRHQRNRLFLNDLKSKTPCKDCGKVFPHFIMEFDHLPQYKKKNTVGALVALSLNSIKSEIAKCEIVCANCHRQRTYTRNQQRHHSLPKN